MFMPGSHTCTRFRFPPRPIMLNFVSITPLEVDEVEVVPVVVDEGAVRVLEAVVVVVVTVVVPPFTRIVTPPVIGDGKFCAYVYPLTSRML